MTKETVVKVQTGDDPSAEYYNSTHVLIVKGFGDVLRWEWGKYKVAVHLGGTLAVGNRKEGGTQGPALRS